MRIRHILLLIFCYFITRILQGQRDESTKVDNQMAKNDAKELQEVTRKAVIEQSVTIRSMMSLNVQANE